MKNTFKKSMSIFMLLTAFAIILTGCSKNDSSSSSGGGSTPTPPTPPTPPTGNYGTITVAGQPYNIKLAMYGVEYDEELQFDITTIALADATPEDANMYLLSFPHLNNIPTGDFTYTIIPEQGKCMGVLQKGDNEEDGLRCMSGNVTITKNGSNYKIVSSGSATPVSNPNTEMPFSVNFEGPVTLIEE